MRKKLLLCLLAGLMMAPAAFTKEPPQILQTEKPKGPPLYIVQPNDELEVIVWKQPDLSRKVTVRPDGRISLPTIQDLQASGLNPGELKAKIEEALKDIIDAPNVTVIVDAIKSYRVFVGGKVGMPGAISAEKPITVVEAIFLANGFAEYANKTEIVVIRSQGEDTDRWVVNFEDIIKGRNLLGNRLLKSGDVVYVQ